MVARPPVKVSIAPMQIADLEAVHEIERASFRTPWPSHAYRTELETNRLAHYLVARVEGTVVAYGGLWMMADEAHITTFAVAPERRRQRLGERLLLALLDLASGFHAHEATLEVRLSNLPARRLYEKYGFRPVGLRPRYYSDDHEDALIMTTEPLASLRLHARLDPLREALEAEDLRLAIQPPAPASRAADPDRSVTIAAPPTGGGPNVPGSVGGSDPGETR